MKNLKDIIYRELLKHNSDGDVQSDDLTQTLHRIKEYRKNTPIFIAVDKGGNASIEDLTKALRTKSVDISSVKNPDGTISKSGLSAIGIHIRERQHG
jgi:biopolymer transport protein ExbD